MMADDGTEITANEVEPGTHMRTMARLLTEHGYDVRGLEWKEGRRLTITNCKFARCRISAEDSGSVTLEYAPWSDTRTEPANIREIVLRPLGVQDPELENEYVDLHWQATLKGAIGREMSARGLTVELCVFEDELFYTVDAEVKITNPEQPERGVVYVTDDGFIRWECDSEEIPGGAVEVADTTAAVLVACSQVPLSECVT